MGAFVFISHSSKDRGVAERLCAGLEKRGHACWISSRDIGPGQNFQEAIVAAIRAARVMVLVFTSNANASEEIKKEVAIASLNRVPVIPVRMMEATPGDAFAYELATRQWIDVFDDWEGSIERLANHLTMAVAAKPDAPDFAAAPIVQAGARRGARNWSPAMTGIAVGVMAVAFVGLSWWYLMPHRQMRPVQIPAVASQAHPSTDNPYVGEWRNEDQQTRGITRVEISIHESTLAIHLWGRCHPTDCDQGEHFLDSAGSGSVLHYAASFPFKVDTGSVTMPEKDVIELSIFTHFTDTSRRADHQTTYRLRKD
jgi:hypothetical protein